MEAKLIESILLENSASPLLKALEVTKIGNVPSDMTGFDTYKKQMYFTAGLEGVSKNREKDVEQLITDVFKDLFENGIPKNLIETSLHQLEIKLKKISGGFPYGLQLLMSAMPYILHGADISKSYDLESSLGLLKKRLIKKKYLENKINEMFLSNNSRLTFQLVPDIEHDKKQAKIIDDLLAKKMSTLDEDEILKIKNRNNELEIRQNKKDDPNILPKVTVNDVGKSKTYPKFKSVNDNGIVKHFYRAGTNGIDYFQTVFPISSTSFEELNYSTLFADIICEVGIENKNYEEIQKLQSFTVGQISSNFVVQRDYKRENYNFGFKIGGYSLQSKLSAMKTLIMDTLNGFRLDEIERLNDITKMHFWIRKKSYKFRSLFCND